MQPYISCESDWQDMKQKRAYWLFFAEKTYGNNYIQKQNIRIRNGADRASR